MEGKLKIFFWFLLLSTTFASNIPIPWMRSKIRVSPPRPLPGSKPVMGGNNGNNQCGGSFKNLKPGQFGVITSPGYPNNYDAGLDCEWIIQGEPGSNILASFFDIRTQNVGFSDVSDSLYVSLSGNWSESQRLSGDLNAVTPLVVMSDSETLLLRFKSSQFSTGNRGFRIGYYHSSTGKPAATEAGHDVYTVISCNYSPTDLPTVFPSNGQSLKDITRTNPNPFLVGLILDESQFCSGTLVSDRHVVTSAHCTKGAEKIEMVFGTSDLLVNDTGVQRRTVDSSAVKEHPFFDTFNGGNDISVIQLNEPVALNRFVEPAELPTGAFIGTTMSGLKADVVGWGDAKSGSGNIFSQATSQTTRVSSNAACRRYNRGNTGHSMCTLGNSTANCQTDSGSPIVTRGNVCGGPINQGGVGNANAANQQSHPNRPHKPGKPGKPNRPHKDTEGSPPRQATLLLGIVSHGSCENGFSATRITAYLDFLTETIGTKY